MLHKKIFVGAKLRQIRRDAHETQMDMAKKLGISASYVNLLERNQRSLSVSLLLKLVDTYGVELETLTKDDDAERFARLRQILKDPTFEHLTINSDELHFISEQAPDFANAFRWLYDRYCQLNEHLADGEKETSSEESVHDFFRSNHNHFQELEQAAELLFDERPRAIEDLNLALRNILEQDLKLELKFIPASVLGHTLRYYDRHRKRVLMSDALDFPNRVFQMAHQICLLLHDRLLNQILNKNAVKTDEGRSRSRIELANYFAAAVMMPYDEFLETAQNQMYDIDLLASHFGVSFEQACQRLTAMYKPNSKDTIPFFFIRIDKAGNVSKRFSANNLQFARHGGACPRWQVHDAFFHTGRVIGQVVDLPDGGRYFTFMRQVERPPLGHNQPIARHVVALGCPVNDADKIIYFQGHNTKSIQSTPIGINCRLCPRRECSMRAFPPVLFSLSLNEDRRGQTRFES